MPFTSLEIIPNFVKLVTLITGITYIVKFYFAHQKGLPYTRNQQM